MEKRLAGVGKFKVCSDSWPFVPAQFMDMTMHHQISNESHNKTEPKLEFD